jgi:hypothetical protein
MNGRSTGVLAPLPPDHEVQHEQLYAGFAPLVCHGCGSQVLVRKAGPAQTSIQWTGPARCPDLPAAGARAAAATCGTLACLVAEAVADGRVVQGDADWSAAR